MASLLDRVRVIEGSLDARGLRFAIVVGRFNAFITERLLEAAVDTLVQLGAAPEDITVVRVPGAFELAAAARRLLGTDPPDALIALGCLMRGDTIHFDLIAGQATKGLADLALAHDAAVTFGVLTTDTLEQAIGRAGGKHGNKGAEAAHAAVEQARLLRSLSDAKPRTRRRGKG